MGEAADAYPLDVAPEAIDLTGPVTEWELPPAPYHVRGFVVPDVLRATGPDGRERRLAAFDDGAWRVRLNGTVPGRWMWRAAAGRAHGELDTGPLDLLEKWPRAPLRVSDERRYLVSPDGTPFFYLADTAWAIVWKGTPDQWQRYLDERASQGFSVIQVNLLPWRWHFVDVAGNRPFHDGNPEAPNAAYFRRYDEFLAMAAERGLFVCLMLLWGGPRQNLPAAQFTTEQSIAFARYAVARFGAFPLLWSLSGDGEYAEDLERWEAVGDAVEEIDPDAHPTTNHLPPSMNWRFLFHRSPWHDFHMLQTGHRRRSIPHVSALPAAYYALEPIKPVVNGEPWYEAHPSRDTQEYGPVFRPIEVRYAFWVSILSGATMGHTYGSQGIWNWRRRGDSEEELAGPQIGPTWSEALYHPGAQQCALGAELLRSLPWWALQPRTDAVRLEPPPRDYDRRAVCAVAPGQVWVVYLPAHAERGVVVIAGLEPEVTLGTWFDPRTGSTVETLLPPPAGDGTRRLTTPTDDDWVLVLSG